MALVAFYAFHDFGFLRPSMIVRGLALVGALSAFRALLQVAETYSGWLELVRAVEGQVTASTLLPPAIPRITNIGDNVNVLAMALNLLLPFSLAIALQPARRFERGAAIAGALLMLAALFFTLSRGAWLGTIAALMTFGVLYAARGVETVSFGRLRQRLSRRLAAALAAGSLLLLLLAAVAATRWESRPESLFRASLGPRADALEVGIEIVRDRPFLGSGPYTYPLLYSIYSGAYPVENIHPHNGYVNVLVDTGFAGGLVMLAAGLMLVRHLALAYRDGNAGGRVFAAACSASLVSLAVHSLLDAPNIWSTALMPLAVVLALSLRLRPRPAVPPAPRTVLVPRLLAGALPLLLIASWVRFDLPHADFDRAVDHLARGEFAEAVRSADRARDGDPSLAAYDIAYGVNAAILHLIISERGTPPPELLEHAAAAFERASQHEPRGAIAYANLALARLLQDDGNAAAAAARRALSRTTSDGGAAMAAGTVLEWAQYDDEAAYAYGLALSRDPGLVQSPFWVANPTRFDLRQRAIASSGLTDCEVGRIAAFYAGFPDDLRALANGCRELLHEGGSALARADLAVMLVALGQDEEALREANTAVSQVPDNPFIRTSLAVALMGSGDLERVRHELMIGAYLGDPDAALFLAYTYQPPTVATPVLSRLRSLARREPMPGPVRERLEVALTASAPMVFDDGVQYYKLGALYYRVRFLRESPTSILVPGEWLEFASPRTSLIAAALKNP